MSVGVVWYGLRSSRSSGYFPGATSTISISMAFSAMTIRVRWLHGSSGAEKSVIVARRLDTEPSPRDGPLSHGELAAQRTSFQYSFFNMYAMAVNMRRN